MGQRLAGIVLLLLAVVGALAGQGLRGDRIPGNAMALPVSSPPLVGDCLLDPPDLIEAQAIYSQKPWATGSCTGQWYGEITAVISNPDEPESWPHAADAPPSSSSLPHLALFSCQAAAYDYVGAVIPNLAAFVWFPALRLGSVDIAPSSRQQAGGQHWRACVLFPVPDDAATDAAGEAMTLTLKNAIDDGAMSDSLGICTTEAGFATFDYVGCTQPHTIQYVALGFVDEPVQRNDPSSSCTELAEQLTGRSDLEADGELAIELSYVNFDQVPRVVEDAVIPVGSSAVCAIRSSTGRQLAGSLLGLGNRPIPWS